MLVSLYEPQRADSSIHPRQRVQGGRSAGRRDARRDVGGIDIVIENGRVRAGYHVGWLLDIEVLIHFIGERPGTGIDTMSAYLTYGRDKAGQSRWGASVDHSWTTAVCGIHRNAKPPETAADEIAALVNRMFELRCSGVALG